MTGVLASDFKCCFVAALNMLQRSWLSSYTWRHQWPV